MKIIYLIRHAKSDKDNPKLSDIEQILSQKGIDDAHLIRAQLIKLNSNPEIILCSTSKRTKETFEIIYQQETNTIFDSSIYQSSLNYLIFLINSLPNQYNEVAIIGHHPGVTLLANYLTDDVMDVIPTCGVVKIELEIDDWKEIVQGIGNKKYFISPKAFI